jgi:RHS repeat-associated protein
MTHVTRKNTHGETLYSHQYLCYDLSGNLLRSLLPNNLGQIHYCYDLNSRRESIEAPGYSQKVLETDKVGNIRHLLTQDQHFLFTYDEIYQLTSESGLFNHTYSYDSLYCRLAKDHEQYQINALNQVASHMIYDKNGNPLRYGDAQYTWDALDRLIQIQTPESHQTFIYDSQHRRLSATTRSAQGEEKTDYFLYDGQKEIGSLDTNLQVQTLRVLGSTPHAEIGAAVGIELGNKFYAPIHDLSGNITMLLPLDGAEPEQTYYSVFGEETGSRLSPWRFSSKRVDEKNNLVYYGRRFYQPELGRWLSPDPAGFTDGMNLYAFVHNDPLTHFDEYGLLDFGQWERTPQQRLDEQRGMIWGVSRWARSFISSTIDLASAISRKPFPEPDFYPPRGDALARSINRSISRFTARITPYQVGNADFERGVQIGYWGSTGVGFLSALPGVVKAATNAYSEFSGIRVFFTGLFSKQTDILKREISKTSGGWVLPENRGGALINGRWYTEHALERMAPRTPQVMAKLEARALERTSALGLQPGTREFGKWMNRNGPNPRGIPPSVVEAEIFNLGTTDIRVILNENGHVITIIPGGK